MAVYNTSADAANTAVRGFLTVIGEYYLGRAFNTGSKKAKEDWLKIRDEIFEAKCAYCGVKEKLQIDHLIMINRTQFGLHHPGNIVPACSECNTRTKKGNEYNGWEDHLSALCERNGEKDKFFDRYNKIKNHREKGEYIYPVLTDEETKTLKIIINNLYDRVKSEFEQSVNLYEQLDTAFTKNKF